MIPREVLETAIQRAYAAFAHVPRPMSLDASPLRDAKTILRDLTAVPLRQLSPEQIGYFASCAMTTVGTTDDYRHFLPRILELAVRSGSAFGTEPESVANKLVYAEWSTWDEAERAAVIDVFETATAAAIEKRLGYEPDAEAWLCGLSRLGIAPAPWLARWRDAALPAAGVQLAHLVTSIIPADGEAFTAYWEEVNSAIKAEIANWLFEPATRQQLSTTRALAAEEDRWLIDLALQALGHGELSATRH
jgi:hypothetical protein